MPAEKGIPKPEASARRLDVRNYDSREAWGWLSEDECLITQQEFLLCSQKINQDQMRIFAIKPALNNEKIRTAVFSNTLIKTDFTG